MVRAREKSINGLKKWLFPHELASKGIKTSLEGEEMV